VVVVLAKKKQSVPTKRVLTAKRPRKRLSKYYDESARNKELIDKAFHLKEQNEPSIKESPEKDADADEDEDFSWMWKLTEKDSSDSFSLKKPTRNVQLSLFEYTEKLMEVTQRGDMEYARELFEKMIADGVAPSTVVYDHMMTGYLRQGDAESVFALFDEMFSRGLVPTHYTYNIAISACAINAELDRAEAMFQEMRHLYKLRPDIQTYSALIHVCVKAGDLGEAERLVHQAAESGLRWDVVIFTTIIAAYAYKCNKKNGEAYVNKCFELKETMKKQRIQPNIRTYTLLMKACSKAGLMQRGLSILHQMTDDNVVPDDRFYVTVLSGLVRDRSLEKKEISNATNALLSEAKKLKTTLTGEMHYQLIRVFAMLGEYEKVQEHYERMKDCQLQLNLEECEMLLCFVLMLKRPSNKREYLRLLLDITSEIEKKGGTPTASQYGLLIRACGQAEDAATAKVFWDKVKKKHKKPSQFLHQAMVLSCMNGSNLELALQLLDEMISAGMTPEMKVLHLLFGYCKKHMETEVAEKLFEKMKALNVKLDQKLSSRLKGMNLE